MTFYTDTPRGRKVIGKLSEDGQVLHKVVRASKHLLNKLDAWGVQQSLIKELPTSVAAIQIVDRDDGRVYTCSIDRFLSLSKRLDLGYGSQLFLPRKKWTIGSDGAFQPALF